MPSIFTRIVQGDIPAYKVAENEHCIAFLDINPLARGHTLVIPKKEIDYLFDVEEPLYSELMRFAADVARGIKQVISCERIGMAVIGLEVPHAHIHLVPINSIGDINFMKPKLKLTQAEFLDISARIRAALVA